MRKIQKPEIFIDVLKLSETLVLFFLFVNLSVMYGERFFEGNPTREETLIDEMWESEGVPEGYNEKPILISLLKSFADIPGIQELTISDIDGTQLTIQEGFDNYPTLYNSDIGPQPKNNLTTQGLRIYAPQDDEGTSIWRGTHLEGEITQEEAEILQARINELFGSASGIQLPIKSVSCHAASYEININDSDVPDEIARGMREAVNFTYSLNPDQETNVFTSEYQDIGMYSTNTGASGILRVDGLSIDSRADWREIRELTIEAIRLCAENVREG